MENASKALLIAGAILLTIMILSLSIFAYNKWGSSVKRMANMDEQQMSAFNSKITPYVGQNVSGSQVNALLQYCLSANMSAKETEKPTITVKYTDGTVILNSTSISFSRVSTGSNVTYNVSPTYNDGLITLITIKKN